MVCATEVIEIPWHEFSQLSSIFVSFYDPKLSKRFINAINSLKCDGITGSAYQRLLLAKRNRLLIVFDDAGKFSASEINPCTM